MSLKKRVSLKTTLTILLIAGLFWPQLPAFKFSMIEANSLEFSETALESAAEDPSNLDAEVAGAVDTNLNPGDGGDLNSGQPSETLPTQEGQESGEPDQGDSTEQGQNSQSGNQADETPVPSAETALSQEAEQPQVTRWHYRFFTNVEEVLSEEPVHEQTILTGETVAPFEYPEIEGYQVAGLYLPDGTPFDAVQPAGFLEGTPEATVDVQILYEKTEAEAQRAPRVRRAVSPLTKTHTYVFWVEGAEVDRQIVKDNEKLYEPAAPEKASYKFVGWYPENEDTPVDFDTPVSVTETRTINVIAKFQRVYYVFFMDGLGDDARVFWTKEGNKGFVVSTNDVRLPLTSSYDVTAWYQSRDLSGTPVEDQFEIPEKDTTLWPKIEEGNILRFHPGKLSSHVPSQFVIGTGVTKEPEPPTRPGYKFKHWSTTKDGAAFVFGQPIQADTDLYGVWEPLMSPYNVIYWIENADDDGYSLESSRVLFGTTDSVAQLEDKTEGYGAENISDQYRQHFTFDHYDTDKVIEADGSTSVNVYYKRNQYTLTFTDGYTGDHLLTIKDKYNAYILDRFPKSDPNNPGNWNPVELSVLAWPVQTLERMPGGDIDFEFFQGALTGAIEYYLETLEGGSFDKYKVVNTVFSRITYEEEYHPIQGFDRQDPQPAGFVWEGEFDWDEDGNPIGAWTMTVDADNPIKLYYLRHAYTLTKMNGEDTYKTEQVKFEVDLAPYYQDKPPQKPLGVPDYYEFKGWYLNPTGADNALASDNLKKMPDGDVLLYAKWAPPILNATIYWTVDGSTPADGRQPIQEKIPYNEILNSSILPTVVDHEGKILFDGGDETLTIPEGHKWVSWAYKYGSNYVNFAMDQKVKKDVVLYPFYVSDERFKVTYQSLEGTGTPPTDNSQYAEFSYADVRSAGNLVAPAGKVFVGWKVTSPAGDDRVYHPGDKVQLKSHVTLTAQWRPVKGKTQVTYLPGVGSEDAPITKELVLINAQLTLPDNPFAPKEGHEFIGWENATDHKIYAAGYADLMVDEQNDTTANRFIARWKRQVTVNKNWVGGSDPRPEVSFKLLNKGAEMAASMLNVVGGTAVAFDGSLKQLPAGQTSIVWTVNPSLDDRFTVKEEGVINGLLSTDKGTYKVSYAGLTVTNEKLFDVRYEFKSGTADKQLPDVIKALKPATVSNKHNGDEITPTAPRQTTVLVADGEWTFQGYEPTTATINNGDVTFEGTWTYKKASYTVEKTVQETTFLAVGETLHYTITVTNTGETTFANLTVADNKVDLANATKVESITGNGKLEPGETWTYTYTYTTTAEDVTAGGVANKVTVTDGDRPGNPPTTSEKNVTKVYTVSYTFKSGTADKNLPADVTNLKPADEVGKHNGDVINPTAPKQTTVLVADGEWTFQGYNPTTATINNGDVTFEGTWTFKKASYTVEKTAQETTFLAVGETLHYTITVTNTGETTFANLTVADSKVDLANATKVESITTDGKLEPGETWTYTYTYTTTREDVTAGGVANKVTVTDGDRPDNPPTEAENKVQHQSKNPDEEPGQKISCYPTARTVVRNQVPTQALPTLPKTGEASAQITGFALIAIALASLLMAIRRRIG